MKNRIFLTGASGFLGEKLCSKLIADGHSVIATVRSEGVLSQLTPLILDFISDISELPNSLRKFDNVDTVIHVAAKAHTPNVSLDEFRQVNTEASIELARSAARQGVKRFIFISSIGVNGVKSDKPFSVNDEVNPSESYAISKLEAEIGIKSICQEGGMEFVIIRPPLVYGRGAPGNFGKLMRLAGRNLPMPLSSVKNLRSFVSIDNLVDLICCCLCHPKAANETFLVSDGHDLSTSELMRLLIIASGKKPKLFPFPPKGLFFFGGLVGIKPMLERMCGNLQVDITHTVKTLDWTPPVSVSDGIARCFAHE